MIQASLRREAAWTGGIEDANRQPTYRSHPRHAHRGLDNQVLTLDLRHPTTNLQVVIFPYAFSAYDDWRQLAWAGALLIAAAVPGVTVLARAFAREPSRS